MKQWRKGIILAILMALFSAKIVYANPIEESESAGSRMQERRIEQVFANLPQIVVYGSGFTKEEAQTGSGYLADGKLQMVRAENFSESGEAIFYYVMLDISGSIPDGYLQAAKQGILNLALQLRERDRLIVYTVGEEVRMLTDGNVSYEELDQALAGLKNRDQETLLFEGIDRLASEAEQEPEQARKVFVVISDGEDVAVGKKMAQEALQTLQEKGYPLYALCIQNTKQENANSFGAFARASGGDLTIFRPEDGEQILTNLEDRLLQNIRIEYLADRNVVTNKEEVLTLKFADGSMLTKSVMNRRWIPDMDAPEIVSGAAIGEEKLSINFSEPVIGGDQSENYRIMTEDGAQQGIAKAEYEGSSRQAVLLTLENPMKNGWYRIECTGLTDDSMEKNILEGAVDIEVSGMTEPEPEKEGSNYSGGLFLIFAAILILGILIIMVSRKKKVSVEDIGQENSAYMDLEVQISVNGRQIQKTVWKLTDQLVVGRIPTCDVFFDDPLISRQHFIIEREDQALFLTDLNTTNGTLLNGNPVQGKVRLTQGAVIEAGDEKIMVWWKEG